MNLSPTVANHSEIRRRVNEFHRYDPNPSLRRHRNKIRGTLAARMDAFERDTLRAELGRHRYNMSETAKAMGLERSHLYKKCAQLGIRIQELRKPEDLMP